ncbi:uncharacterized protein LOC131637557 [Vicia villosa]|uniref:uncharacterized protein LOC131637557 n=1 Tax=Vicia villosa TaxID=3911 RepID=UPI00273ADCD1|nr:uncharacterized protein LOC131637557 [Vicia villosa]
MREFLNQVQPAASVRDSFSWKLNAEGVFTVKSVYDRFFCKLSGPALHSSVAKAAANIWSFKVPAKLQFFGWRVIHNRIATNDQLCKRGILDSNDLLCVFCKMKEDSLHHLLGDCEIVGGIWKKVLMWINYGPELSLKDLEGFPFILNKVNCLAKRSVMAVIWLASIWCIWLRRNAIIFKEDNFSFTEVYSDIVVLSWCWIRSYFKIAACCNFYYWNTSPLLCVEK